MSGGSSFPRDADPDALQRLNRDLIALLALPAMWPATAGAGRTAVVEVLLDVLISMLRLDWVFVRLAEPAADLARVDQRVDFATCATMIGGSLDAILRAHPVRVPEEIDDPCGGGRLRLAAVPLAMSGGVVVAASKRPAFPTERDLLVLRIATNQTSIGVEAARLMEAEKRRSIQLSKLAGAALAIQSLDSLDAILGTITDAARDIVDAHQAVTSTTTNLDFAQAINAVSLSDAYAPWRSYETKPDGSGIYRIVCETNRPMRLTHAELERHPAFRGFGSEAGRHPPLKGWLAAPLIARDGRNIGLIQLSHKREGEFDDGDERILVQLAQMAAIAIENFRLTEDLRRTQEIAIEADRRKDEFLAMLGHELRNPLAPILTALELMKARQDPSAGHEREIIERQARHLARLVDDLLDISRVTRGKVQLRTVRTELSAVLAKALEVANPLIEVRQHDLQIDVPPEGLALVADPVRLAQVFANLLTNAAKYTPPRGRIRVRAWKVAEAVTITVTDNGTGIAPEALPHVFEMFFQGERTIDRAEGGLGLGLALVRSLVTLHGGTVGVQSAGAGKGSEFTVTLPATAAAGAPRSRNDVPAREPSRGSGRRVLLVDDNVDARDMLAEALQYFGHRVWCAADGVQALSLTGAHEFDVALLDIGLPVMDGYELAHQLRLRKGKSLRIFALTGYGLDKDKAKALGAGFEEHFVKPVDLGALDGAIRARDAVGR